MPKILGVLAVALIGVSIAGLIFSYYRNRQNPEFRMQGFQTSLSKDVVATVTGYERRESDGERVKYYIRADKAVSFADNHLELENAFFEVFSEDGSVSDKMSAAKAVYIPAEDKTFTAYFAGSVNIETRDALKVKTEQLTYTKGNETATAEELVEFERANVHGRATGAVVRVLDKALELQKDVQIFADQNAGADKASVTAGHAVYDQAGEKIELSNGVSVTVNSASDGAKRITELSSARAVAFLSELDGERGINKVELFDAVKIASAIGADPPTRTSSNYALYDKPADKFELRDSVYIITIDNGQPAEARAANAVYEQSAGKINLTGNASLSQGVSYAQGSTIYAELDQSKKVKFAEVRDNALVRQSTPERTAEVTGGLIKALFDGGQHLTRANVVGAGNAAVVPANPGEYTKLTLSAASSLQADFKGAGLLGKVTTGGRTNVKMDVPNNRPDASNKMLSADAVVTNFRDDGQNISTATASGNAELVVSPLNNSEGNYKTTITALKFDCEFFDQGNDPRLCTAATRTRTVRVPTQPGPDRGTQNITSESLIAGFSAQSRELESLEAVGSAKFTELERNATSERIVYTAADQTVRLRGGEPVVWDNKARAKAPEIDWDTKNERSELRGGASTTYFSPKSTGGAAPFGKSDKPVYVTAQTASFDHRAEIAVYTGNARGWQDNNYVRGERLVMSERDGRFVAEQNVQSLLYEAKRREKGAESNQPIFVSAQKLTYVRDARQLRYENDVDIRQGKDRITGGAANIFLTEDNEPARTEVEQNVVIVQPTRRAVADFARYDASTETFYLRGNPATIEDREQGRSQAAEITMNLKENVFVGEAPARQRSSGRTRSVYKINNQ